MTPQSVRLSMEWESDTLPEIRKLFSPKFRTYQLGDSPESVLTEMVINAGIYIKFNTKAVIFVLFLISLL